MSFEHYIVDDVVNQFKQPTYNTDLLFYALFGKLVCLSVVDVKKVFLVDFPKIKKRKKFVKMWKQC